MMLDGPHQPQDGRQPEEGATHRNANQDGDTAEICQSLGRDNHTDEKKTEYLCVCVCVCVCVRERVFVVCVCVCERERERERGERERE